MAQTTRRQHLEDYIVGSVLSNRKYLRDCAFVAPYIQGQGNKEIFALAQGTTSDIPAVELVQRYIDAVNDNKEPPFTPFILLKIIGLSGFYDFDFNQRHYNHHALVEYYLHGTYKVVRLEFSDYLNKFIELIYGTNTSS